MLNESEIIGIVQSATQETGKNANELTNDELFLVVAKSIHRALQYSKDSNNRELNSRLRSNRYK